MISQLLKRIAKLFKESLDDLVHITSHFKVRKLVKIKNRYNQVPHLTQDTNGKVTNSQIDITTECQEVSHFPAFDHKASINRRARKYKKHKTEIT